MFRKQADFEAFERVMVEAHQRQPIRMAVRCLAGGGRSSDGFFSGALRIPMPSAGAYRIATAGMNGCGKQ